MKSITERASSLPNVHVGYFQEEYKYLVFKSAAKFASLKQIAKTILLYAGYNQCTIMLSWNIIQGPTNRL